MSKLLPVVVKGLALDTSDSPVVLLEEKSGGDRVLPIWIGVFEATSIQIALDGVSVERPLTHDLMLSLAAAAGAEIAEVAIVGLRDNTYFAKITLMLGGPAVQSEDHSENEGLLQFEPTAHILDARPSDALAVAVRSGAPILVAEEVFERGHIRAEVNSDEEALRKRLEDMGPDDLGKYTM